MTAMARCAAERAAGGWEGEGVVARVRAMQARRSRENNYNTSSSAVSSAITSKEDCSPHLPPRGHRVTESARRTLIIAGRAQSKEQKQTTTTRKSREDDGRKHASGAVGTITHYMSLHVAPPKKLGGPSSRVESLLIGAA